MSYTVIDEAVGGLGGLGAMALASTNPNNCPWAPQGSEPSGLSQAYRGYYPAGALQPTVCTNLPSDPGVLGLVAQCNQSSNPNYCLMAKQHGLMFLGRGSKADVAAWRAWRPGQASADVGVYAPPAASPPPSGLSPLAVGGLVAGGVLLLGIGAWVAFRA